MCCSSMYCTVSKIRCEDKDYHKGNFSCAQCLCEREFRTHGFTMTKLWRRCHFTPPCESVSVVPNFLRVGWRHWIFIWGKTLLMPAWSKSDCGCPVWWMTVYDLDSGLGTNTGFLRLILIFIIECVLSQFAYFHTYTCHFEHINVFTHNVCLAT